MPACHATRAFWPFQASESAWLAWLVVLAALLAMASGGPAEARTAKIALVVSGDEQMQADLKELVERFEKEQPLSGDSLGLLQGAQAALARINTALRSRGYYDATITATVDGRPIAEAGRPRRHRRTAGGTSRFPSPSTWRPARAIASPTWRSVRRPRKPRCRPSIAPSSAWRRAIPPTPRPSWRRRTSSSPSCARQGYALASIKRDVVVNHATREADGHLRRRDRAARPHGPGALLGHRQGRHRLAAAPRAVQGGRALRSRPRSRPCAASSPRSACSTRCASSPRPRSTPTASCRSMSN